MKIRKGGKGESKRLREEKEGKRGKNKAAAAGAAAAARASTASPACMPDRRTDRPTDTQGENEEEQKVRCTRFLYVRATTYGVIIYGHRV